MMKGLVSSLVVVMLMALLPPGASAAPDAESVPQCPVDAVPIQIVEMDRSGPVITLLSAASIPDPHPLQYRSFVAAIVGHVAARLSEDKLCIESAESRHRSLLQFEFGPPWLETHKPVQRLDAPPSSGCRILSPWIDLAFERKPVPWIRAIVRWNHRQFLADQAVLAGAKDVPPDVAMPLTGGEFRDFLSEYEAAGRFPGPRRSETKPIEERVPPDILWLFRHTGGGTLPFGTSALGAMLTVEIKNTENYTKLVIALIDRCFVSDGASLHYSSILDVSDLIPLERYKIDSLYH